MTDKSGCLLLLRVLIWSLRQRTFYLKKSYEGEVYRLAHKAPPPPPPKKNKIKSSTGYKSFSWFVQQNWHPQQWCCSLAIILFHWKQGIPRRKDHDRMHPHSGTWHILLPSCEIGPGFRKISNLDTPHPMCSSTGPKRMHLQSFYFYITSLDLSLDIFAYSL